MLFDRDAFLERVLHDEGLARLVLATFAEDIPCQVAELRKALTVADVAGARRRAHTMKGASANVGAVELARLAETMEILCEAGRLGEVVDSLDSWDALWGATQSAMATPPAPRTKGATDESPDR